ncbi:MAG: SIS domain-containing protein, partial [Chloroflexota bacterium]
MGLRDEILQQPDVIEQLLDTQWEKVKKIAAALRVRDFQYIFLTARGTSDNAGLYAKYLLGINNGIPTALAAPSIFSMYGQTPKLANALVLGISQSGQSPDIVSVLQEARKQEALTLAITNAPDSPLAQTAEFSIDIFAGEEKAVAATKTYTAQLVAVAMLAFALSGNTDNKNILGKLPDLIRQALTLEEKIARIVQRYFYMSQCAILGRGYNYATAFEWALKLKELSYIVAEPYSSADFQHGPIAIVDRGFPLFMIMPKGKVFADMLTLAQQLHEKKKAETLILSNDEEALALADTALALPADMPEWLSPMVSIVPAQLFCYHLTRL